MFRSRQRRLLLEALDEPLEHADPDLVLAGLVLDAVLEIGVVVDLHDDEAAVGLLDVDVVEPLPDRPRRAHRNVDQRSRRLGEPKGGKPPSREGAVGAVRDDLPGPRARRRASRTRSAGISAPLASRVMARGRMRSIESQRYDR